MQSPVSDKEVFDFAGSVGIDQSSIRWRRLLLEADYYVLLRTVHSYELAVEKLAKLRSLAITTSDTSTFNTALSRFRARHSTKSMFISMLSRSVAPI